MLAGLPEKLVVDVPTGDDEHKRVAEVVQVGHGGKRCCRGTLGANAGRRVLADRLRDSPLRDEDHPRGYLAEHLRRG